MGQFLSVLPAFHFRGFPRIDIPLVHDDHLHFTFKQEIRNRAFHPRKVTVFTVDARIPLAWTRWPGEHGLQRPA
jgi:hypothetical protein